VTSLPVQADSEMLGGCISRAARLSGGFRPLPI